MRTCWRILIVVCLLSLVAWKVFLFTVELAIERSNHAVEIGALKMELDSCKIANNQSARREFCSTFPLYETFPVETAFKFSCAKLEAQDTAHVQQSRGCI